MLLALAKRAFLVIAPIVMVIALTQKWYFAETDTGQVYGTRFPLDNDTLVVTLVCCCIYVVIALLFGLRLKWLVGTLSLVFSSVAVATLFLGHSRLDFPDNRLGQTTEWFNVAAAAGVIWIVQSVGLVILAAIREPMSATGKQWRDLRSRFELWCYSFYVPGPSSTSSVQRLSGPYLNAWFGIASGVAMVIGAFGPWAQALTGLGGLSVSGTVGSSDGWLVIGAAVVGVLALVGAIKRGSTRHAVFASLLGLGSAGVCLYDRQNVENVAESDSVALQAGWGINLALVTSLALAAFAVTLIKRRQLPGVVSFARATALRTTTSTRRGT